MKKLATVFLLGCAPIAPCQKYASAKECIAAKRLFFNSPSVANLTASERRGVISVVLPDLRKNEAPMGLESSDLVPDRLALMLRYTELAVGTSGERVVAITFREPDICGNSGQCTSYILGIGPHGVRSLVPAKERLGLSVGGTWGAAVIPRRGSDYPDLLVLATISGSEVAVSCYRWQGTSYTSECNVPCSQILAHPDQQ